MAKKRKIPMRMCLGCKNSYPKKELIRVVRTNQGDIKIDLTGKVSGRGAYICKNFSCFDKAYKSKSFDRALNSKINDEIYQWLKAELAADDE
ncbi:MAG TPA: YlxR family protein [Clostridiales bacterium]|nr:YlxR family protein [Clostridiales bacterium]